MPDQLLKQITDPDELFMAAQKIWVAAHQENNQTKQQIAATNTRSGNILRPKSAAFGFKS